ncbi:Pollen receptor-like kinase [Actinidia chinensis var. chinensis]|uniref:Pollen receptor-like kinase n=1 Tax=Actinidia chinensis var. chinensis TaxID=1590841 RepID=A0A2R6QFB0_ACTCC|nr:Pollen receptor-like kinase [Actinidia chinensis var. chinensis]
MAILHVLGPSILCFAFLITVSTTSSISESEALIKLKRSMTNTEGMETWGSGKTPCDANKTWVGVSCENGRVSVLALEDMGLSGTIDVDALLELQALRVISFQNNSFSGPIPDFNRLGALKAIFLSKNQFSGEIPSDYFAKMESLKKVWLGGNSFTGNIPVSLANLPNLTELNLKDNQFSGAIPSLAQPPLAFLNLSNNLLQGEIPASLQRFNASSFLRNPGLCGEILGTSCNHAIGGVPNAGNKGNKESNKIAAGLMTTAVVILSVMLVAIFVLRRKQEKFNLLGRENLDDAVEVGALNAGKKDIGSSRKGMGSSRRGSQKGSGDLVLLKDESGAFGLTDLMKAGAEVLGNGAMGSSYKAMMTNGMTVVVKRIKDMNKLGREGFDAEMRRFGRFRHQNVLTPLAYHYRKDEKLLVHKHIAKGSLLYLLHGDRGPSHAELNWSVRLRIIQGIARGLGYLYSELGSNNLVPHGNLKSSNVLLGSDFEPLLVDYGFSPLVNNQQAIQALHAYRSPEAALTNQISPKCDVYCLGIIILEVLTGKFPSQYLNNGKGGIDLVQWVKSAVSEGRGAELIDPEITNWRNALGEMEKLIIIGAVCTDSNPDQRPEIRELIKKIEEVQMEGSGHDARAIQVFPTLRHGCPEVPGPVSHVASVQEGYGGLPGQRYDNFGERSAPRNSGSFAFDIS